MKRSFIQQLMRSLIRSQTAVLLFFVSCGDLQVTETHQVRILTWNTQNLFDDQASGREYPEFDPSKGWTRADYWGRLERCAEVLTRGCPQVPDIVLLQELENAGVLETLRTRFLDSRTYPFSLLLSNGISSVNVGVLSRWPLVNSGLLTPEDPLAGGRPVLEVRIRTPRGDLVVLNNHWKSRIPDRESTEAARKASAALLVRRMEQLEAEGLRFVAAGDFNTYPVEGTGGALGYGQEGILSVGTLPEDPQIVWDPWSRVSDEGSYFYHGIWEPLDHFFIGRFPEPLWVVDFRVLKPPSMTDDQGRPLAWSVRNPRGVSDHLPLWLELEM